MTFFTNAIVTIIPTQGGISGQPASDTSIGG